MSYLDRTDSFMASLGAEAYRVGGSVRDEILGRKCKDADYMVRGLPLPKLGAMLKTSLLAMQYRDGTVKPLVLRDGRQAGWRVSAKGLGCIEIVLPRTEISTGPGHRDFKIVLDPNLSLEEDAKRRDFTFNALYLRVEDIAGVAIEKDVVDPTGKGVYDLQHRCINVTHADSFRDDPLRMLRALRFVSTLGYELGRETRALMMLHAEHVAGLTLKGYVSGTVLDELSKMLAGQSPAESLRVARDTGVLAEVLPELAPMLGFDQGSRYHDLTTDEHVFTALETAANVDAPLRVRWALLFHDSGKPETAWVGKDGRKHYYEPSDKTWAALCEQYARDAGLEEPEIAYGVPEKPIDHEIAGARIWLRAANRLQADKALRDDVNSLIRNHMVPCQKFSPTKVRRARVRLGDDLLRDLYLMRMCDLSGKGKANKDHMLIVSLMEAERSRCEAAGVPRSARDLQINGHDMQELGVKGKRIGDVLSIVLDAVVCDPSDLKLSRDWQMKYAETAVRESWMTR